MRPGGVSWLRLKPRKTPHRGSSTWQKPSLLPWAISLKQEPAEELLQINATLRRNLQPLGWGGCQCLEFSQELRTLDPVDELAYLSLECEMAGRPGWGTGFYKPT